MKIVSKWNYFNGKKFELKLISTEYCCNEIKQSSAVIFGEVDTVLNRNEYVNISNCTPYPEGAVWDEEAINYCPFCGTKIKVIVEG
jgi:hypothetical protein